jgi:hypothetical protein
MLGRKVAEAGVLVRRLPRGDACEKFFDALAIESLKHIFVPFYLHFLNCSTATLKNGGTLV